MRICPKCKGKDISPDLTFQTFAKGSIFNAYKCNNCDYAGEFFPEVDE